MVLISFCPPTANPIVFDYENTAEGFAPIIKYSGATDSDLVNVKLSGDFDGNGEQDFVTDNKLYLNPIDNGSTWTGIDFDLGTKYFTANTLDNSKLNQSQSIVKIEEGLYNISFNIFNTNPNQVPYAPDVHLQGIRSIDYFDNAIYHDTSLDTYKERYSTYSSNYKNECYVPSIKKSNEYLEGDFNGDGISEVLIYRTKNERFYNEEIKYYQTGPSGTKIYNGYECKTKIIDEGKESYWLNLDPTTSSALGSNGFMKLQNDAALQGEKKYVIDFNGDGKSDVLVINADKSYNVVGFKQLTIAPWVEVEILSKGQYLSNTGTYTGTDSFSEYDKVKQIVFGDFNGDSKTDIMFPEADGSSNWFLYQSTGSGFERISYPSFELYQPYWQGSPSINRTRNKSYRAADLDKDGKSDFIIQEYETFCVDIGWGGCDRNGVLLTRFFYKKEIHIRNYN